MIIRKRHKFKIASLAHCIVFIFKVFAAIARDAWIGLIVRPQTNEVQSGVIEIKPLRGFFMVNADNHFKFYT